MSRVIAYYQSFEPSLDFTQLVQAGLTHIHLSSVHFGVENDYEPYIHLNDNNPSHPKFKFVWEQMQDARRAGAQVRLMIGGAGGGYQTLFDPKYKNACTALLIELLQQHAIDGVDFAIEEPVNLSDVYGLWSVLAYECPRLQISFAPVSSSLASDSPGMGGFVYKTLYTARHDQIDYLNGQFYGAWGPDAYTDVVNNGYPSDKVVMGAMAGQAGVTTKGIKDTKTKFPNMAGVFIWELIHAQPSPLEWVKDTAQALTA